MSPANTRRRKYNQDSPAESSTKSPAKAGSKRQKNLPVRAKDGEAPTETSSVSAPAPANLKVFTDDDEFVVTAPTPAVTSKPAAPVEEEEEEDSDDEAPEAVSTTRAATDVNKLAQAAQKVAQEQAATQKRKRQERDALFKKQAEERKKLEEEAKSKSKVDAENDEDEDMEDAQPETGSRRRRTEKVQIPNLLPAEFLTDSSSEDEDEDTQEHESVRPKKRKVSTIERGLSRQNRGPRDERVGSTVYRVAKKVDERMAPKLQKHAKSSKELLLKRNRSATKSRSGFLVGK